eukprot:NODE_1251_length_1619_cov_24.758599_g1116_i0.p2 GENE.NODE_1251_length_1619_cov_24.758599_g1116_i0~~NODE_1251_length_1619_cov_24.758599_g1116_i0.p2  ORF type:complete len:230 (-),score=46.75 NODE_1251_length_1619_cov_24.758599_g1116_i0:128-817(-)
MDIYLLVGTPILLRLAMAIFRQFEPLLMRLDFEGTMRFFNHGLSLCLSRQEEMEKCFAFCRSEKLPARQVQKWDRAWEAKNHLDESTTETVDSALTIALAMESVTDHWAEMEELLKERDGFKRECCTLQEALKACEMRLAEMEDEAAHRDRILRAQKERRQLASVAEEPPSRTEELEMQLALAKLRVAELETENAELRTYGQPACPAASTGQGVAGRWRLPIRRRSESS